MKRGQLNFKRLIYENHGPRPPTQMASLKVSFPSEPMSLPTIKLPSGWLVMTATIRSGGEAQGKRRDLQYAAPATLLPFWLGQELEVEFPEPAELAADVPFEAAAVEFPRAMRGRAETAAEVAKRVIAAENLIVENKEKDLQGLGRWKFRSRAVERELKSAKERRDWERCSWRARRA
jgi:hypothetical protein